MQRLAVRNVSRIPVPACLGRQVCIGLQGEALQGGALGLFSGREPD